LTASDHEVLGKNNPKVQFVAFDQIDKAPEEKHEVSTDRHRACGV